MRAVSCRAGWVGLAHASRLGGIADYVHRCGRTGRAGNKGTAYTFITPEQERYSGEIVKALELSFAPVPDELRQLWTAFKEKKAAGLVKDAGSGFGGHGFKFDAAEQERAKEKKQAEKALLGEQDSEGEDDDMDAKIEKMMKSSGTRRKQEAEEPKKQQQQQQPEAATAPMLPGPVAADGMTTRLAAPCLATYGTGTSGVEPPPPSPPLQAPRPRPTPCSPTSWRATLRPPRPRPRPRRPRSRPPSRARTRLRRRQSRCSRTRS
jgi:superfamily II DNA/RNA helicase